MEAMHGPGMGEMAPTFHTLSGGATPQHLNVFTKAKAH